MNGSYGEPEQHPGYSAELLSIAQSACRVTYAASEAHPQTRRQMFRQCAKVARRRCREQGYGFGPFLPLGVWLAMTVVGAFISWCIQRELDRLYPQELGAAE